jgi:hypothetical protein
MIIPAQAEIGAPPASLIGDANAVMPTKVGIKKFHC